MTRRPGPLLSFPSMAVVVVVALLGVFVSWPTARYSYDAVAYAALIHRALYNGATHVLGHQYHMLYMPLGYLVGRAVMAAGVVVHVLAMMQVVNAVLTAAYLLVFALLVQRITGRAGFSLALTALLAMSFAVWYYATDPEVYPPSILLLLLCYAVAWRALDTGGAGASAATGALGGLATAFHLAGCLALPPLAVAFLAKGSGQVPLTRRLGRCALLVVSFLGVGLAPYVVYYRMIKGTSTPGGLDRMLSEATASHYFLGLGMRPDLELAGILRAFAAPPEQGPAILAAAAVGVRAVLVAIMLVVLWRCRAIWKRFGWLAGIAAGWLLLLFLLFSIYNVADHKFVAFQLVPLFLLFAMAVATLKRAPVLTVAVTVAAVVVGVVNLVGTMVPWSRIETNRQYQVSMFIRDHTAAHDLVVHLGDGANRPQKVYLPYFTGRHELILDFLFRRRNLDAAGALHELDGRIRRCRARGGRALVFSDLVDDHELVSRFEKRHGLRAGHVAAAVASYRPRPHARLDSDFGLYVLTGP